MKSWMAFMKKEWMEQVRSGRLMILGIIFVLLGIMNPAIAKLTPWMFEIMADSLAESGMMVTTVTVDAMTSWTQFFKNVPLGLIAFLLLQSSIFTKEYQSGTLILALTKGLARYKVLLAKAGILLFLWSVYYGLCFGITYIYNGYFWDNGIAQHLVFSVVCWWLLGVWTIFLMVMFSAFAKTNTAVLSAVGVVFLASYLVGLLPKTNKYMPTKLMDMAGLLVGTQGTQIYTSAIVVTVLLCVVCMMIAIPVLNKKQL